MSMLVHVLAFGTPKFYIAPYDKIKHELVLSSNCDVKSGLRVIFKKSVSFDHRTEGSDQEFQGTSIHPSISSTGETSESPTPKRSMAAERGVETTLGGASSPSEERDFDNTAVIKN